MSAKALMCEMCGAALPRPHHHVTTCTYCGTSHHVGAPVVHVPKPEVAAWTRRDDLHAHLMTRSDATPIGRGVSHAARDVADPYVVERAIWASSANASSTWGGAWGPDRLVGPPTVFPHAGDIAGAWAPRERSTRVEWIEVSFTHRVPSNALRIFETNEAGGVYAVVVIDEGGETLVYQGPTTLHAYARMLEITLDRPRAVQRVRVYIANDRGRSWTEIDAVSALAVEPLPPHVRTAPPPPRTSTANLGCVLFAMLLVLVIALTITFVKLADERDAAALPASTSSIVRGAPVPSASLPTDVAWSAELVEMSSEYSSEINSARQALFAPNVFPTHADLPGAWASLERDRGTEWITVAFASPIDARAIVWVETLGPGTVARIDDVTDDAAHVTLWEGRVDVPPQVATTWTLTLPTPRRIAKVRVVLDTARVAGWNEIDAIGVVPAR